MKKEKYLVLCLPGHPQRREIRKLLQGRCAGWGTVEIEIYPGEEESLVVAHPAGESIYIAAAAAEFLAAKFGGI